MRLLSFTIPGTPVPQARTRHRIVELRNGQRFVGQYDPTTSRVWKATVAEFAARARGEGGLLEGAVTLEVVCVFPPPKAWSKRRRATLEHGLEIPKTTEPDLDNLIKGIADACTGILFERDGQIWSYGASRKIYGTRAEVRVTVREGMGDGTTSEALPLPGLPGLPGRSQEF